MLFDSALAKAEVLRLSILVEHHVRQAKLAGDVEALRSFIATLDKAMYDATGALKSVRNKNLVAKQ